MKFTKIISKNIKLLIRAKGSAFIVIFGPLLIILLVGLALNKPTTYDLSIGYYTSDKANTLTESFMNEIKSNNYVIKKYGTEENCIADIKKGTMHACLIFPANFEMGNNDSNNVIFYVDYSRTNLVYQIIGMISDKFEIKTSELSKDLTQVLLTKIMQTKKEVNENILTIINLKTGIDAAGTSTDETKKGSSGIDFSTEEITLSDVRTKGSTLFEDAKKLKSKGLDAVGEGLSFAGGASNSSGFVSELEDIKNSINRIYNTTPGTFDEFEILVDNATSKITVLRTKMSTGQKKNEDVIKKLDELKTKLSSLKTDADKLKTNLEGTNTNLENIDIVSAEEIVSPIRTEIKPLVSESNQLVFMFPYLLILVIMFIGIMLSSALVMMEKTTKALFRNLTTPTKPEYFIGTTYITSLLILLLQIIIILGLSYAFLETQIFTNIGLTALILFLTMTIFILLGMMIGYLTSTQESTTMLSISIGSIFLLLSNLILPIETMSGTIKNLVRFNPYVISSELFKKSLLFQATLRESLQEILILLGFVVGLILVVFVISKLSRAMLFQPGKHATKVKKIYLPEDCYLKIEKYTVKNKHNLLTVLEKLSEEQFKFHTEKKNEITDWVSKMLKERRLAWKLRGKTREQMIDILSKNIEAEEKKEQKKK